VSDVQYLRFKSSLVVFCVVCDVNKASPHWLPQTASWHWCWLGSHKHL